MSYRDVLILCVCIVVAAGLLIVAASQLDYINSQRHKMKLVANEPLENAPPSLAFATVAMGAFRGLVVDVLWIRADELKNKGQFFDAKQLAEWITFLQPRFAKVWEFHSWNMAYNISVAMPASQPQQRWRWVKNGYELLRDRGIPLNPNSILLYRQLAWIFQSKIGAVTDDTHKYYKLQLALAIEPLLGPANKEYFEALTKAPAKLEEIIKDSNVASLIEALASADESFGIDDKLVSKYLALRQKPGRFKPTAFKVIDNFRGSKALEKFDTFAKAYQLRNVWKLEPALMNDLNHKYGPIDWTDPNKHLSLDWRHPDSHAIYWAVKGLEVAGKKEYSIDETNTDRIVAHSLQNLFRHGKIYIYKPVTAESSNESPATSDEIFLRPDLRMFVTYNEAMLAILNKYKDIARQGVYESLTNGHRSMLINAVLVFYQGGLQPQALKIFNQLRKMYPRKEYNVSLVQFARNRLIDELKSMHIYDAKEMVTMLFRESYFRYAMHDDDEAFGREKLAKEVYRHYQSMYSDDQRIDLPDIKLLRYFALVDFLEDWQYPPNLRRNLLGRIRLERPKLAEQLEQQERKLLEESEKSK
ncbi:MAG: hypothetical protein JXB29_00895 [Sedimentisphaerales bacterium]|nr:hypothetical protein [Sedimentisphaerales bacterium]